MSGNEVVLGSASERRRKIMRELGLSFLAVVPEVDERVWAEDPLRTVRYNALLKQGWCRRRFPRRRVITADTAIDFQGRCIEKPVDIEEARQFLRMFSGRTHRVLTAVALYDAVGGEEVHVDASEVQFRALQETEIETYLARVDPLDKAGAYDIDQEAGLLIAAYRGSRSTIMGLPRGVVASWMQRVGTGRRGEE